MRCIGYFEEVKDQRRILEVSMKIGFSEDFFFTHLRKLVRLILDDLGELFRLRRISGKNEKMIYWYKFIGLNLLDRWKQTIDVKSSSHLILIFLTCHALSYLYHNIKIKEQTMERIYICRFVLLQ